MVDMKVKFEMILILALVILYSSTVTAVYISDCVTNPTGMVSVDIEVVGVPGPEGPKGDQGPRGYPGDTSQCEKIRKAKLTEQISPELIYIINSTFTKCGIYSLNWRRVTYIDTTQGAACPDGLREVNNSALNKRACGRTVNEGCSSLNFTSGGSYTHVCGRARGYRSRTTESDGFRINGGEDTIDDAYVDGLSITRGSPRKHIWSYAAGISGCDCYNNSQNHNLTFVGNDYFCEQSNTNVEENEVAWDDPLWDRKVCSICCGGPWFHKEVPLTTDNIEVRWCCDRDQSEEDFHTDIVEIWVL